MNMTGSDSSVVFSQPVTGFASIAFGYPNAFWGEPQTPGIQPGCFAPVQSAYIPVLLWS